MQTFHLYQTKEQFIISNGDPANALRINGLADLLKLRQRLNEYIDTQATDGPLPQDGPLAASQWIDTVTARKLAEDQGLSISMTGLRSALDRGNIPGARKRSKSGRAQTEQGGQWEMPRWAFLQWLAERRG